MMDENDIFSYVHYAQLRQNAPAFVRDWLDDASSSCEISDEHGFTLLHYAVLGGVVEIVALLLERGARVNSMNAVGDTPLHLAAQLNRLEIARLLLSAGAIPKAVNNHGNTPLHYAVHFNCREVARLLLEAGAPISAQNNVQATPVDVAFDSELAAELRQLQTSFNQTAESTMTSFNVSLFKHDKAPSQGGLAPTGLGALELCEKLSESRSFTTWRGIWDGIPVIARCIHSFVGDGSQFGTIRRTDTTDGPRVPTALAKGTMQLLAETERLRVGRGTMTQHPCILPLLACIAESGGNLSEPVLLSRQQALGSLYDILHINPERSSGRMIVDQRQALRFAHDIAQGMEFLHKELCIIQDSAANANVAPKASSRPAMPRFHLNSRNVVVDIDPAPIARINLAKCELPGTWDTSRKIIRHPAWYAPEELQTAPSALRIQPADMFSFGVVMWELSTRVVPFAGLSAVEIGIKVALEGLRIHNFHRSVGVSPRTERLISICTNDVAECRPTFDQVGPILQSMIKVADQALDK